MMGSGSMVAFLQHLDKRAPQYRLCEVISQVAWSVPMRRRTPTWRRSSMAECRAYCACSSPMHQIEPLRQHQPRKQGCN
jgi:hypothetical protein